MRTNQIEQRELVERTTAVMRSALAVSEIGPFVGRALGAVAQVLAAQHMSPVGPPFARYHRLSAGEFDVEVGFVTAHSATPTKGVSVSSLPAGPAAVMTYIGPYEEMEPAYRALAEWVALRGEASGDPWEVYFSDPAQEPDPQSWRTEIVLPFRR